MGDIVKYWFSSSGLEWSQVQKTQGGLTRKDLFKDKYGNLKSRKQAKAKRSNNLKKAECCYSC